MSAFLLIRHASHDYPAEALPGRTAGVGLSPRGRAEAAAVAESLRELRLDAIYSSPRERARETAAPLAQKQNLEVLVEADFDEIDYGEWTGKKFKELDPMLEWKRYNSFRSAARIPGGELFIDVQRRMVAGLQRLCERRPDDTVAIYSHGDPIRTAIAFYAGVPLDFIFRLEVDRASVSAVSVTADGARVLFVNAAAEGLFGSLQGGMK